MLKVDRLWLRFALYGLAVAVIFGCLGLAGWLGQPASSPLLHAAAIPGEEIYFTILHTNDEHSSVIPHSPAVDYHPEIDNPTVGGYARLATAVNQVRQEKSAAGEPVLMFSGGDYVGGSPFSWLVPLGMAPELTLKQLIGYDAVVIGNHEFDYGPEILSIYLEAAGYPQAHERTVVLASNTVPPAGHPLAEPELFRKTHLVELENGITVGMFGMIGEDAATVAGDNPGPVEFLDRHETAREMVAALQGQGADVIIAITHAGVKEDRALARAVPDIDVIVGGHCHTALHDPVTEGGTIIAQAGSLLEYLGVLELAYSPTSGEVRLRNEESSYPFLVKIDNSFAPDPAVEAIIEEYTAELNSLVLRKTGARFLNILDTVVLSDFEVRSYPPQQETPFANFVTDAMRLVTAAKTGERVDVAIQANGQIRGSIVPGTMEHSLGKVSFFDLADLIGLGIGPDGYAGYPVVSFYLTGEEILRALEVAIVLSEIMDDTYYLQFSGLRYDFNPTNAILLTVPVINQPIPAALIGGGALTGAELYTGEGIQGLDDAGYVPLEPGDERLYRVVSDRYIVSFLPMVGEMLPMLEIVLKDRHGNSVDVDDLDDLIVLVDGEELKVWQTVVEYAASQPLNDALIPQMDPYYQDAAGRSNEVWSIPLIIWPILILLALIAGITFLARRHKRRKRARLARSR